MRRSLCLIIVASVLVVGSTALAQQPQNYLPQPRISSVFPTGGKVGSTTELTFTGTDFDDEDGLVFSHPKIKAEVIVAPEPKPDPKAKKPPAKRNKAQITTAKFKVTIPADVPPGVYDVRLSSNLGVSNPRAFVVGTREEVVEKEPNNDVPEAQKIAVGTVVSGVIANAQDVDYFAFPAKAGQRILVHCASSSIDSRARPLVEVYASDGRRLAMSRNYADNDALADVTIPADGDYQIRVCEFAYQAGGPDYFYRLTVSTGPWVDAVFPPIVNPGKSTPVTVYGRGLPGGKPVEGMQVDGRPIESLSVTVTPPTDAAARSRLSFRGRIDPPMGTQDGFEYQLPGANPVPIFLTDAPVVLEGSTSNDTPETAQAIPAPCDVAGRIEKRYDRDFYSFTAKKGDVFSVELFSDRIGGGMDTYYQIRNEKNENIGPEMDDDNEVLHQSKFFTRNGDPQPQRFTAPADGKYLILVGSREATVNYGPRCVYRLRVGKPTPDFRAIVMPDGQAIPSAGLLRHGGETAYDVYVDRLDGFADPVIATAENLPPGVTATPALIGTGAKWGTIVLSTADGAAPYTGTFRVVCKADIAGKSVTREARPASVTWPTNNPNIPAIVRLDQQLVVAIRPDKSRLRIAADFPAGKVKTKGKDNKESEIPIKLPLYVRPGDKLSLPVKVQWKDPETRANPVNVFVEPTGVNNQTNPFQINNNQPTPIPKEKNDGIVSFDVRTSAKPGVYAVQLRGETLIQYVRDPMQKDKKTPVTLLAYADPLTVTVLPTVLAKVNASQAGNLKVGGTGELLVRVERQNDFDGEFQVNIQLPKETKGLTVKDAKIPAGQTEVKIPLQAAADAKPGGINGIVVTVTGTVHSQFAIEQETKVNVNISK